MTDSDDYKSPPQLPNRAGSGRRRGGNGDGPQGPLTPAAYYQRLKARCRAVAQDCAIPAETVMMSFVFKVFTARVMREDGACGREGEFILKGGYALELRFQIGRTTKDLDFVTRSLIEGIERDDRVRMTRTIRAKLQALLSKPVGPDDTFFLFEIEENPRGTVDDGHGVSLSVRTKIGGQSINPFHVDIALPFRREEGTETVTMRSPASPDAGSSIDGAKVEVVSKESHYADKIHAYTRNRGVNQNSRFKDLVDLVLLSLSGLDPKKTWRAVSQTFRAWATHDIPETLPPAPEFWEAGFKEMARRCNLPDLSLGDAHSIVSVAWERIRVDGPERLDEE